MTLFSTDGFPCAKGCPAGLSGLPLRVWYLADGHNPVCRLAAALGCSVAQVLTALDLLDHVGLVAVCASGPLPAPMLAQAQTATLSASYG